MIKIGLDFAFKTCGVAILSDKRLIYDSYDITSKKFSVFETQMLMTNWIWEYIKPFLLEQHQLIIEDVFSGINPKASINAARSQGALIDRYMVYSNQVPKLVMAASARKTIGIDCRWSKAQIQMYIVDKFALGEIEQHTRSEIISLPTQFERKQTQLKQQLKSCAKGRIKIIKKQLYEARQVYNKEMGKLSTLIKQQTQVNEHCADAIVLAMQ